MVYVLYYTSYTTSGFCLCQAEDGIRDLVRSRGLGDVYKRQEVIDLRTIRPLDVETIINSVKKTNRCIIVDEAWPCLLYTSDAADERSSVDLGGRRIIKKKNQI